MRGLPIHTELSVVELRDRLGEKRGPPWNRDVPIDATSLSRERFPDGRRADEHAVTVPGQAEVRSAHAPQMPNNVTLMR